MAAKNTRLPTHNVATVGPKLRRWVKRDTARAQRRLGRLLLGDAPKKLFTRGWAD